VNTWLTNLSFLVNIDNIPQRAIDIVAYIAVERVSRAISSLDEIDSQVGVQVQNFLTRVQQTFTQDYARSISEGLTDDQICLATPNLLSKIPLDLFAQPDSATILNLDAYELSLFPS